MANWDNLKTAIQDVIKENGNEEITGQVLQNTLLSIVNNVGQNATFAGVATPETNPGTPDGPVFYFAFQSGTYNNFNSAIINNIDNVKIFQWGGSTWSIIDTGLPNNSKVTGLVQEISDNLLAQVNDKVQELSNKVDNQKNEVDAARDEAIEAIKKSIINFNAQRVTPEMLSESTLQLINSSGGGTVINIADDEDLYSTNEVTSVLKFKNKDYVPENFSGLGRIYLRKNIQLNKNVLTQEMINTANTRYIIQYDYDLNEETITIPEGCVLDFQGGSISNGTITGADTTLQGDDILFRNIKIAGSFYNLSPSFFYDKDFSVFKSCIENSLDSEVDFKGNTYTIHKYEGYEIRRGNCEIKNFNLVIDENSEHIFILLRFFSNNISIHSFTIEGNNKCTRGLSFENAKYIKIYDGIINNIGNADVRNTAAIEFLGNCSFSHVENMTINSVQALSNASGISISYKKDKFSSFINIENCSIKNINSPEDADGIAVVELSADSKFYNTYHSFSNLYFENCNKRALKLACSYPRVKNIICENGTFGQACIDFFGDYVVLDGLVTNNLTITSSLNCIFLHDYTIANIKNIKALNNNITFDKFNALIYDASSQAESILNLENIETDYNVLIRNYVAAENKTLSIKNVRLIAGYHYSFVDNPYNIAKIENLFIDKSKLSDYWWGLFDSLPSVLVSMSCLFNIAPIKYKNCNYKTQYYSSQSGEKLLTLVNNDKRVTFADDLSYPTKVYYKYYNIGDEIELPTGKIKCNTPPSEDDRVGKWDVISINSKDIQTLKEFIDKPNVYTFDFNKFDLYNKSITKLISKGGWYAFAKLKEGSAGFVTFSKKWGNGKPSPVIVSFSYGFHSDLKLIGGNSQLDNDISHFRINKIDTDVFLEFRYHGSLPNTFLINISNCVTNTELFEVTESISDGEIVKELCTFEFRTSGEFSEKPNGAPIGFAYFCTDKQTSEGSTNGIMIYSKGNNVWVDALGRVIS
jgi:hypothetical protein